MKLTREDIERMEAGREMDRLVLENVLMFTEGEGFSYTLQKDIHVWIGMWAGQETRFSKARIPQLSTNIVATWEVVERMGDVTLHHHVHHPDADNLWYATIVTDKSECIYASGYTAPLAICRAALLVIMDLS